MKCDETKPTCEQCARRRITCGGYKIDVRWKQTTEPKRQSPLRRNRVNSLSQAQRPGTPDRITTSNNRVVTLNGAPQATMETQQQQQSPGSRSDALLDLMFPSPEANHTSMSLPTPRLLGFPFSDFNQETSLQLTSVEQAPQSSNKSPQDVNENVQTDPLDYSSELWNMETLWDDYLRPLPTTTLDLGLSAESSQTTPAIFDYGGDREDEVERIAYLFHQQTCHTLSIEEEAELNPWKTLIWPLTKDHPAVYHAIAALTCFSMNKQQPQLRIQGTDHLHRSTRLLSENREKGEMPLDAALAATLALGFAATWDDENPSIGTDYIRGGGVLLQQMLSNRENAVLAGVEATRLEFLAHTWTYMDVLARFTSTELSQDHSGLTIDLDLISFPQTQLKLNPLMGYSTTFFPIMRRVADLINKVRGRESARNSPAIISQALELRRTIEQWTLPIELEAIDDPSQVMTDTIQTAEAYRWCTLLILYQAVPELPNLTSYGELAQKILVYLATIPLSSSTIIIHIFPLMVAGCDAVEEEDRQFVRERWKAMSERMVTGIVDRCLKITEETWKRKEEYLWLRGLAFTSTGRQINANSNESATLSKDIASFINLETRSGSNTASSSGAVGHNPECIVRKGNDFPISAAFKKGVDMLTRSGCTEYTVRGRLHWLGVMKDWDWQSKS